MLRSEFFCGESQANAARFSLLPNGTIQTETLPRPFLEVPLSLVRDDDVPFEFIVFLDNQQAKGRWVTFEFDPADADPEDAERAFCFWKWDNLPAPTKTQPLIHRSLQTLETEQLQPITSASTQVHAMHVMSRRFGRLMFGSTTECRFQLLPATKDSLWPATWGDYMAWVLLSQVQDHATWEEVRIARAADAEGKLGCLPTGDGIALVFRNSPEAPVQCALELSKRLKAHPELKAAAFFPRARAHTRGSRRVERPPTELIIFGNARGGTPLMQSVQTVGIDLPLKILVWEDTTGKTWISYNEPIWIAQRHSVANAEPVVSKMAAALSAMSKAVKDS
jgi:hypothetical protein